MRMKKNWIIRKSDGKKLEMVEIKENEVCFIEEYSFWTPTGNEMKPIKMWQPMSMFDIVIVK